MSDTITTTETTEEFPVCEGCGERHPVGLDMPQPQSLQDMLALSMALVMVEAEKVLDAEEDKEKYHELRATLENDKTMRDLLQAQVTLAALQAAGIDTGSGSGQGQAPARPPVGFGLPQAPAPASDDTGYGQYL